MSPKNTAGQLGIPFSPDLSSIKLTESKDATQTFVNMGLLEQFLSPIIKTRSSGRTNKWTDFETHINFGFFYLDGKWSGRIIDKQWKNPRGSNNIAKGSTLPECIHNAVLYFKMVKDSYGQKGYGRLGEGDDARAVGEHASDPSGHKGKSDPQSKDAETQGSS